MDMPTQAALRIAEKILRPFMPTATRPEEHRLDVVVPRARLVEAASALTDAHWGYLAAITGLDLSAPRTAPKVTAMASPAPAPGAGPGVERLEALYHFCEDAAVVTLRVEIPYADPTVPTLCDLIPSATLYERELSEMFGITVEGTPVADKLLLPVDWPDGVYPLRRDYKEWDPTAIRDRGV
jgi:NADH:ubiquinone oxidoreductase subunit C